MLPQLCALAGETEFTHGVKVGGVVVARLVSEKLAREFVIFLGQQIVERELTREAVEAAATVDFAESHPAGASWKRGERRKTNSAKRR